MKLIRATVFVLAGLMILPAAWTQEKTQPLPKNLPAYGPLVPFRGPQVVQKRLANGLTLWMVSRAGFPKVSFAVAVRGGMASDPKDRPGLSKLLMDTIDQGTQSKNARQIAEAFQADGGDLTGDAHADFTESMISVLASWASSTLETLSDVLENATFPNSEVALAKRNEADSLRASEAEPSFLANRALAREMFDNHPYSVTSLTQASLAATTPDQLRRAYAMRFRPDRTILVAVGDFDPGPMANAVQKALGGWTTPAGSPAASVPQPVQNNPHGVFLVPRKGSVQTAFRLGAFGPLESSADFEAAEVADAIYGGMFGSRLVNDIREDKGYTYSPGADIQERSEAGVLETRASVRNAVTGASLNEILYQMNRMATTSPTPEELTRAKRYLTGIRAIEYQLQEAVAERLASLWVVGLPPQELGEESSKIQTVTFAEVDQAGRKYFPASRQTIVAVGEQSVIQQQLKPFGLPVHPVE
ncbi:MAG TPA: pitrilysin family protein [Terriglobia bacterium]|nr:pitrilysin family protein [Terriglobia bacterium]